MENDGLVFYGLTDELENFKSIINKELNDENIGTGNFEDKFKGAYEIYTLGGRRDIVLEFKDKTELNLGKLAIWRLKLNGLASWVSDYIENSKEEFESD
jgi:hypothetical protein